MVLEESGTNCGIDTQQDRKTILRRFEAEGEEFYTITLASMVKDLYQALDQEELTPDLFPSLGRFRDKKTPIFLGGFFEQIFEPKSGILWKDEAHRLAAVASIRSLCQIFGLCSKLNEHCTPVREYDAMLRYLSNEVLVETADQTLDHKLLIKVWDKRKLRLAAHALYEEVLTGWQFDIQTDNLVPSHGPGATADKLTGNRKWAQPQWSDQLEDIFPYGKWAFNSWSNYYFSENPHLEDSLIGEEPYKGVPRLDRVVADHSTSPEGDLPVKVIAVPKTQKTPRIIAVEPTAMQYMQQALRRSFENNLERSSYASSWIGYSSQLPNQQMAKEGSITGKLATLDLSDASDLVSWSLVQYVLHDWPDLLRALDATRSKQANVLDQTIRLHKYASMGSALCFPIEAMMFSIILLVGIYYERRETTPMRDLIKDLTGRVRVYGDDIIVPRNYAPAVVSALETFGLKVNTAKSFWSGNFRESCGKEYWHGFDVTYVKLRYRLPSQLQLRGHDADGVIHGVAFRNNLYANRCYPRTVFMLDEYFGQVLNGHYPEVHPASPALGRHNSFYHQVDRFDDNLQKPMVKAYVVSVVQPRNSVADYGALMKCLLSNSDMPYSDLEHLLRSGRPLALRIKLRWTSPV